MSFDLVLHHCRIAGAEETLVDIGIKDGRIAAIAPSLPAQGASEDIRGNLVLPGFVETHIHLDKSCILDRCSAHGNLADAIAEVATLKQGFTEDDIYSRARQTLEKSILQGTTCMRVHVEVDPRIGLRGFNAMQTLKREYAWAIDLEICVFPQEGLLNDPGADKLLVEACGNGADLIGGCPYTDHDPNGHVARIFAIAREFDLDIDFHLDFDLDPTWMRLDEVCRQTIAQSYGGRVAIGHVTKLSAVTRDALAAIGQKLADAGVAVTTLPSTDLFLMGRAHDHNIPRGVAPVHQLLRHGVTCSISTNNVLNPFTPFGDCSLLRMANLYANVTYAATRAELTACFEMITTLPARLMAITDYGIVPGNPADLVVVDAADRVSAIAELKQPLTGLKRGIRTFTRLPAQLHRPLALERVRSRTPSA